MFGPWGEEAEQSPDDGAGDGPREENEEDFDEGGYHDPVPFKLIFAPTARTTSIFPC